MKELRIDNGELLAGADSIAVAHVRIESKLAKAGFDLNRDYAVHRDPETRELIYTQEEDADTEPRSA